MSQEPINLTTEELVDVTGLKQPAAQMRALAQMGIPALVRPDGKPLVARAAYLLRMGVKSDTSRKKKYEPDLNPDRIQQIIYKRH